MYRALLLLGKTISLTCIFDGNSPYTVVPFGVYTECVATKHEENKKRNNMRRNKYIQMLKYKVMCNIKITLP